MKHPIHIKSKFSCLLFLLTSCALFIACQPKPNTIESANTTQHPEAESTTIDSSQSTNELAAPTMTPTSTMRSNPLPTPTGTLPATLIPGEAKIADMKMAELYKTNGGCQLPCWWGFMPGETKWTEAKSFLSTLTNHVSTSEIVSESNPIYSGEAYLFFAESNYYRQQLYTIKDDIIENIVVQVGPVAYPNFTLATILSAYGVPSEIWLDSYGRDDFGEIPFSVVLFYPDDGMLLKYYTNASLIDVDGMSIVEGCIQDKAVSNMGLWSPEAELTFADAVNQTNGMRPSEGYLYQTLEDVTDMTVDTFYQTYIDPNTKTCIETPAELWQDR